MTRQPLSSHALSNRPRKAAAWPTALGALRVLLALALILFTAPAFAQWQVAAHAVPLGRGAGVGFAAAAPATAGQVLLDKGSSTNPAFTALGGDVSSVNSSGSVTLDPEIHCLAGLTSAADKIAYYTGSGTCALGDFGSAVRTFNTTSSSANLRALLTDEVGTGAAYFVGGALGTPASATLTNATGLPISGITGLGTGVGTALAINTGSAGAPVLFNGAGGTPSSITLTNGTGLPVSGITASTSTPLGVGSIELGHASDTTIARSGAGAITVEGVAVPTISSADTLSNKTLASPISTGTADVQQAIKWSGDISPTQITANQNDYAPTGFSSAAVLRLDLDADHSITGIAGGADGLVKIVHNISTHVLTLVNQSASSTAANRLLLGGDIALNPDTSITLQYDSTSSRWRAITSPGAGGGGGGVTSVAIAEGVGITKSGTCSITTSGTCTITSQPNVVVNCSLTASVSSNALTVALKGVDGNDPSSTNECYVPFRNVTAGTGTPAYLTVTGATSIVMSSGSTGGFASGVLGRMWVVAFNDGSTFRLGLVNARSGSDIMALRNGIYSSTAEGGSGAADSAQVIYTGTAVTSKAMTILGYIEATEATAGTWATAPSTVKVWQPGDALPGDLLQTRRADSGAVATGTTILPHDDTIPQNTEGDQYLTKDITPSSGANLLAVRVQGQFASSVAGASFVTMALFQDSTANALAARDVTINTQNTTQEIDLDYRLPAGSTSTTTMKMRAGNAFAGTTTFNGGSSARFFGGVMNSFIQVDEICG